MPYAIACYALIHQTPRPKPGSNSCARQTSITTTRRWARPTTRPFRPPQPSRFPVTRALAHTTFLLAAGSSCKPLSEFRRTWWRPGDFRGAFLLFELCSLVPDARSASQSLDGRLLFAAELSMRLVGTSGAVGRVEASD